MSHSTSWWLPPGTHPDAALILTARGIRAFTDGYVALLLPYYLTLLGYSAFQVGAIATATLLGSGLLTLLAGMFAYRYRLHVLLTTACLLMLGTGLGFALATDFLPLLLIAVIGTLNPSSGDVSVFSPLEQSAAALRDFFDGGIKVRADPLESKMSNPSALSRDTSRFRVLVKSDRVLTARSV